MATQRIAAAKADGESLAELQAKGMQYDAMPPAEREAMRKAKLIVSPARSFLLGKIKNPEHLYARATKGKK